ncbi:unnamed protein product, partial [Mesorhabditis belari]|uniref:F-box domain-containing protein n=1 Tax=Mesorhabditis belari TaxID=2138241 RepID=A0AAF3EJQ2_9BILA
MPFPVQQLPFLLQESILEHLAIGEALQLLKVKKNFRDCIQFRGPFLKKFNSIEVNHWKQITRINEDGFKAVSIKIDDYIFETTTNLLANEVNKNQILIDQRFSRLFNQLHFCKKLDVWERNFQGVPSDSKEFDFLKLLPQKIRSVDNLLISAFRLCSMNEILQKLDRIAYRAICIRFYMTYSLSAEISRVREYLERKRGMLWR